MEGRTFFGFELKKTKSEVHFSLELSTLLLLDAYG